MSSAADIQEVWTKREVVEYRVKVTGAPRHLVAAENLYMDVACVSVRFTRAPGEWWEHDGSPVLIGRLQAGKQEATYMEALWDSALWPAWIQDIVDRATPRDC